jgi:predicted regulator of Ras-like GTPase activity (Roadblock/LC7/MglB family)
MPNPDAYASVINDIESGVSGFIGASIVDLDSGMPIASRSSRPDFDLEVASAYNSEMVKAKLNTIRVLNIQTTLEDMLLTLGDQLHLIKMVGATSFVYVAADRSQTNLALLRQTVNRSLASLD